MPSTPGLRSTPPANFSGRPRASPRSSADRSPSTGTPWGAVGEAWAAHLFDLTLLPTSAKDYDAIAPDGTKVQIKATVSGDSVGFSGDVAPERLIPGRGGAHDPAAVVWDAARAHEIAAAFQSHCNTCVAVADDPTARSATRDTAAGRCRIVRR